MANQQRAAKAGRTSVDRISSLPDTVLHHVLSFHPTKFVVQTCVLSKRWKDLWCSVPCLDFDQSSFLVSNNSNKKKKGAIKFCKFVDLVLLLRECSNIEKLRLSWSHLDDDLPPHINVWIIAAIKHKIHSLDLELVHGVKLFDLTPRLFTCKTLRELSLTLNFAKVNPLNLSSICSLETLHLKSITFVDEGLTNALFSSHPNLKTLILDGCVFERMIPLKICSQQLQILTLKLVRSEDGKDFTKNPCNVYISAPSLVSFELHSEYFISVRFEDNLISLAKANIYASWGTTEMIEKLRNAESFAFSAPCLKDLGLRASKRLQVPFSNLKSLKLETGYGQLQIVAIVNLLKHSPNIETLLVENHKLNGVRTFGRERWPNCPLFHLKLVKLQSFRGSGNEVNFVQFLLKNSMVLEKMVVVAAMSENDPMARTKLMKVGDMLLTYPRASSSVGILFSVG